ncbi:MAG: thioredoxin-dependent thiol peroxidase [Lawsonella sp.]|nr:thioredoxin-dependent thiol peroxidase [Mycobacteriales bacterium]
MSTDTAKKKNRLEVGDKAPAFELLDDTEKTVSLSDYAGKKVIVYFYPRANTPGCTKEACDFQDNLALLKDSGISVVAISPDKPEKLAGFRDKYDLDFPLLSDPDKEVMTEWGAFGEKKNYGKIVQGVIRSTFLVDEDGKIALAKYNVRATGHVARILKELELDD